jgi:hypothetical protein
MGWTTSTLYPSITIVRKKESKSLAGSPFFHSYTRECPLPALFKSYLFKSHPFCYISPSEHEPKHRENNNEHVEHDDPRKRYLSIVVQLLHTLPLLFLFGKNGDEKRERKDIHHRWCIAGRTSKHCRVIISITYL